MGCRVEAALSEDFGKLIYDSGMVRYYGTAFPIPVPLQPRTRYWWRVSVKTGSGVTTSDPAWFETGKMNEPWRGGWITPERETPLCPVLEKQIEIEKPVGSARLYICGLGLYELELDGEKVSDEYLTPYCTAYDQWIQAQTFDMTGLLTGGKHTLSAILGDGWYKGQFALEMKERIYGDKAGLICELHITYEDGTGRIICSDGSWRCRFSHIRRIGMYDGEILDYASALPEACEVLSCDLGADRLCDRLSPPVRIAQRLPAKEYIVTPRGEQVLDFGQNLVGWVEVKCRIPKGETIKIRHGEILDPDGNLYTDNLRNAKQEFVVIGDGTGKTVHTTFTFYGFRFIAVEGMDIRREDFTACVLHSDMEQTGFIECSNPKVNRLFLNALWGQKGNFVDVPTDCPQRDERIGWTGDAQVFAGTACFNMQTTQFYKKFLHDLWMDQQQRNGSVANFIPAFCPGNYGRISPFLGGGVSAWGDAATVIPWQVYLHSGDISILERQYPSMKAWVKHIHSQDDGSRLWKTGFHFGDWLSMDNFHTQSRFGATPTEITATAYYLYSMQLTAKAAKVLGKTEDYKVFSRLAEEIRQVANREFITATGRMASDTQTANAVALNMDFCGEHKKRIAADLVKKLKDNNYHLSTGFVGTPCLCPVLSENGYNELAYRLLLNEDYPSWLYEVNQGATTIWERWNSIKPDGSLGDVDMNSYNHYAYGAVVEWMYRYMLGIQPLEDHPGFKRIRIAPQPHWRIRWAKGSVQSAAGRYEVGWRLEGENVCLDISVPFDAEAQLVLPYAPDQVKINGSLQPVSVLRAGRYHIEYEPTTAYPNGYTADMPTEYLLSNPYTRETVLKIAPCLEEINEESPDIGNEALRTTLHNYGARQLEELECALAQIPV